MSITLRIAIPLALSALVLALVVGLTSSRSAAGPQITDILQDSSGITASPSLDSGKPAARLQDEVASLSTTDPAGPQEATSGDLSLRMAAVADSEQVTMLGHTLMADPNPQARAKAADTFSRMSTRLHTITPAPSQQEGQMIDIMQAAYSQERDPDVRRTIVTSAAHFNHPNAATLIKLASDDPEPAVREAADQARRQRDARLVLETEKRFPPATWK